MAKRIAPATRRVSKTVRAKSLSALATDVGRACTVVYIHGIGNKPIESILKCQWDHALFGYDLGARSRMAYWVNREYYPSPSAGSCATGDDGRQKPDVVTAGERILSCRHRRHCTDLGRDRFQQGAGLPNLVKMLVNM